MKRKVLSKEIERRFEYFEKHIPQFDPVSQGLFLAFLKTGVRFRGLLERRLRSYGLTGQAFRLLILLETLPEKSLPMNHISQRLWVTQANVTGLVDTLEKKRLVARRHAPHDRRVIPVALTPAGRQKIRSILPRHFRFVRNLFSQFGASEKEEFVRLLEKFSEGLT